MSSRSFQLRTDNPLWAESSTDFAPAANPSRTAFSASSPPADPTGKVTPEDSPQSHRPSHAAGTGDGVSVDQVQLGQPAPHPLSGMSNRPGASDSQHRYVQWLQHFWQTLYRKPPAPREKVQDFPGDALWIEEKFGKGYGTIPFTNNDAMYVVVRAKVKDNFTAADGKKIGEDMIGAMLRAGYSRPRLLISVTGGAQNFELPAQLQSVLKRGLRRVALTTNAWIVSGGTDCGIMKYVGDAMSHIRSSVDEAALIPVIGIATLFHRSHQMKQLEEGQGQSLAKYPDESLDENIPVPAAKGTTAEPAAKDTTADPAAKGTTADPAAKDTTADAGANSTAKPKKTGSIVTLNPNHTHFFLVKTEIDNFGQEVHVKGAFERELGLHETSETIHSLHLRLPLRYIKAFGMLGTMQKRQELIQELEKILLSGRRAKIISLVPLSTSSPSCGVVRLIVSCEGRLPSVFASDDELRTAFNKRYVRGPDGMIQPDSSEPPPKILPSRFTPRTLAMTGGSAKPYSVLLVVEGGPVTLDVVCEAVNTRVPVVVIEGSGRVADLIAYAWRYLHDTSRDDGSLSRFKLFEMLTETFAQEPKSKSSSSTSASGKDAKTDSKTAQKTDQPKEKDEKTDSKTSQKTDQPKEKEDKATNKLTKLLEAVIIPHRVTIFSLSGGKEIDDSILDAMLESAQPREADAKSRFADLERKLRIALLFQRTDRAADLLEALRNHIRQPQNMTPDEREKFTASYQKIVHEGLMWSILMNLVPMVQLFLPQVKNLGEFLYTPAESKPVSKSSISIEPLAGSGAAVEASEAPLKEYERVWQLYSEGRSTHFDAVYKAVTAHTFQLSLANDSQQDSEGTSAGIMTQLHQVDNMIASLLNAGLPENSYKRKRTFVQGMVKLPEVTVREIVFHELLLWAVLMNRPEMAELFWQSGGQSIANALICVRLLRAMAQLPALQHRSPETAKGMKELAAKFERFAVGVLGSCYDESVQKAAQLLRKPLALDHFRWLRKINDPSTFMSTVDLAYRAEAQVFLGHAASQEVVNALWSGHLRPMLTQEAIGLLFSLWRLPHKLDNETTERYKDELAEERLSVPFFAALKVYFEAPVTKFVLDALSTSVLVLLFAFAVVLEPLSMDGMEGAEVLVALWMLALLLERLRTMAISGPQLWLANRWNIFDGLLCLLYVCAFGFRLHSLRTKSSEDLMVAKGLYALEVMLIILGSCRLYAISHHLGPKLIAVYKMLANFLTFLAFYGLVLMAYGIALQAILFPNTTFDGISMSSVIYRPFFQLFGELMLDDLQRDGGCVGSFPFTTCGTMTALVAPLVGLYLIVSNIMLINLLIAMLSSTYARVEESSIELWRFQFYELVQEYHNRGVFPAPLSIAENLYFFARRIARTSAWRRMWQHCFPSRTHEETDTLASTDGDTLEQFQERHTDLFLDSWRLAQTQTMTAQISKISTSFSHVERLENQLDTMQRRLDSLPTSTASLMKQTNISLALKAARPLALSPVKLPETLRELKRPTTIEVKPASAAAAPDHAGEQRHRPSFAPSQLDALLDLSRARRFTQLQQAGVGTEMWSHNSLARSEEYKVYPVWERVLKVKQLGNVPLADIAPLSITLQVQGRPVTVHFSAKSDKFTCFDCETEPPWDIQKLVTQAKNHEGAVVERTFPAKTKDKKPVESECAWDFDLPDYKPQYYVSSQVLLCSKRERCCRARECMCPTQIADSESPPYAKHESYLPDALIKFTTDGMPLNPFGRTGLRGRGSLFKWGANRAFDQIVTRWARDAHGGIAYRGSQPLLQVLLLRRRIDAKWALPGSFVPPKSKQPLPVLTKIFGLPASETSKPAKLDGAAAGQQAAAATGAASLPSAVSAAGASSVPASANAAGGVSAVDVSASGASESASEGEDLGPFNRLKSFLDGYETVFEGFMDDPRNTDNAWVETKAVHCHDEDDLLAAFPLLEPPLELSQTKSEDPTLDVAWATVHSDMRLAFAHSALVEIVARKLGAYW